MTLGHLLSLYLCSKSLSFLPDTPCPSNDGWGSSCSLYLTLVRNAYTFGYTLGFGLSLLLLIALAFAVGHIFGYGIITAELMTAYSVWAVIRGWDRVVDHYLEGLDQYFQ